MSDSRPLAAECEALRHILNRLMTENVSLEDLCKLAPRVISVSANVVRIQSTLEAASAANPTDILLKALAELDAEDDAEEPYMAYD